MPSGGVHPITPPELRSAGPWQAPPSVGSVGDSYDNALAETITGLYKAELIHRRGPWRGTALQARARVVFP